MTSAIEQAPNERGDWVRRHTPSLVNQRIDHRTQENVVGTLRQGSGCGRPQARRARSPVGHRPRPLRELRGGRRRIAFLTGLRRFARKPLLGKRRKGLLYLFSAQLGFMLLHGVVGWCPPVPVLRRLGVRTAQRNRRGATGARVRARSRGGRVARQRDVSLYRDAASSRTARTGRVRAESSRLPPRVNRREVPGRRRHCPHASRRLPARHPAARARQGVPGRRRFQDDVVRAELRRLILEVVQGSFGEPSIAGEGTVEESPWLPKTEPR